MRFLVDESLQEAVATLLCEHGYDACHVVAVGLQGAPDEDVLARADEEDRILITADTDFGQLLALSGAETPSVILMRQPGRRADQRVLAIVKVLPVVDDALASGAIVLLEPDRIRLRQLPISDGQ